MQPAGRPVSPGHVSGGDHHARRSSRGSLEAVAGSAEAPIEIDTLGYSVPFIGSFRNYIPLGIVTVQPIYRICNDHHPHLNWEEPIIPQECVSSNYPHLELLTDLRAQGLVRVMVKRHSLRPELVTMRIYVLPNDHFVKDHVTKSLSDKLCSLRALVNTLPAAWRAEDDGEVFMPFPTVKQDGVVSLFYFFNTLPSPQPDISKAQNRYTRPAMETVLSQAKHVPGLKTTLYNYQRMSAALMIQREEVSERHLDCMLAEARAPDGSTYYYRKHDGGLALERREYEMCRGGILAETMGLGKTLICLTVILATKYHWPRPRDHSRTPIPTRPKVGSLADMVSSAVQRYGIPWMKFFDDLQQKEGVEYTQCIKSIRKNTGTYVISPPTPTRPLRRMKTARKVWLSPGTLVICPSNLLQQWISEISKHTEPGSLRVLVMQHRKEKFPPKDELVTYDIILFTRFRFDMEKTIGAYRSGGERRYKSPLSDIHWKRIIVDEGHAMSRMNTDTAWIARELLAERRWVVSGTPTDNLIGVDIELVTSQSASASAPAVDSEAIDRALELQTLEPPERQDHLDTQLIGNIVKDFLQFQPWHPATISNFDDPWKHRGLSHLDPNLEGPLAEVFIKHQPEDVEMDVTLPPLHHKVVKLEPSFFDKLSLNNFNVVLVTNAVTSERTGPDYMFDSSQHKSLSSLVSNLRHGGFFWCGFSPDELEGTIRITEQYLEKKGTQCSREDQRLLREAIKCAKQARASSNWKAFWACQEIGCFVENFPQRSQHAWAMQSEEKDPFCIGLSMISAAQKHVNAQLYASDPSHGLDEAGRLAMRLARQKYTGIPKSTSRVLTSKKRMLDNLSTEQAASGVTQATGDEASPKKGPEGRNQSSPPSNGTKQPKSVLKRTRPLNSAPKLPAESPLSKARLIGTASRKLSYLIDQILAYNETEKILCFYEKDYIAFDIAVALDICGVKYLIYAANGLANERRARYLVTFNTRETFRVMIMDVRQAAYGLNLCTATRVYFVNPIWQRNVEAQAIKRAHRIGQTKPVYVETLVLRDTIEDQMLERRKAMTGAEQLNATEPLSDQTVSDIIKRAEFLHISDEERSGYGQIAKLSKPVNIFGRPSQQDDDPDAGLVDTDMVGIGSKRRKKARASRGMEASRTEEDSTSIVPTEAADVMNATSSTPPAQPHRTVRFAVQDNDGDVNMENANVTEVEVAENQPRTRQLEPGYRSRSKAQHYDFLRDPDLSLKLP